MTPSALVRVLLLPVSLALLGLGFAVMLLDRERRALHDRIAGSAVVYDWGGRPAELPTPLSRWLERQTGVGVEDATDRPVAA
ncbi:MAG: RDD family protein [Nitriliruptoraceae bacterium]